MLCYHIINVPHGDILRGFLPNCAKQLNERSVVIIAVLYTDGVKCVYFIIEALPRAEEADAELILVGCLE